MSVSVTLIMPYLLSIICLETLQFLLQSKHPIFFSPASAFHLWAKITLTKHRWQEASTVGKKSTMNETTLVGQTPIGTIGISIWENISRQYMSRIGIRGRSGSSGTPLGVTFGPEIENLCGNHVFGATFIFWTKKLQY